MQNIRRFANDAGVKQGDDYKKFTEFGADYGEPVGTGEISVVDGNTGDGVRWGV